MDDIREIVNAIYKKYNPDKISNIPNLMEKYKGKEGELLIKIAQKYDLQLWDYIQVDHQLLVKEIVKIYDPVNASSASVLSANYIGRGKELLNILSAKYNSNFNEIVIAAYTRVLPIANEPLSADDKKSFSQTVKAPTINARDGKTSKSLVIGLVLSAVIILFTVILYVSGVFSSGKPSESTSSNSSTASTSEETTSKTGNVNINAEIINEGQINVLAVMASSFMKPSGGITYYPQNAIDYNLQTWWTPSPPHSDGLHSWIKLDFGQTRKVVAIEILNGSHYINYPKYGDLYYKNNRLIRANLEFSNGNTKVINLQEIDGVQKISFPVQLSSYIKLIPLTWAQGSTWNDLCISQFNALGE